MHTKRNTTIDFLRGVAVLLMIFAHATAYFLNDTLVHFLWDYSHIIVPLFVFCSAYVYFQKSEPVPITFSYIVKRLKRLLIPYYLYLMPLFMLSFIKDSQWISVETVLRHITWGQGRDVGWLVVLFIYLLILIPIIHFLYWRKKWMFIVYSLSSSIAVIALLSIASPVPFRYMMWLPWSFYLIYVLVFARFHQNKYVGVAILILSVGAFIASRDVRISEHASLVLTENKYPPNLYYLSYGIFFSTLLYYMHEWIDSKGWYRGVTQRFFEFLSFNSYSLFFIHFLFLKLCVDRGWHKEMGWIWFFVFLTVVSIAVQLLINFLSRRFTFARH